MEGRERQERRAYWSPQRRDQARATRARIVAAATELFRSAGYAGTTVPAVARAAGVSVPTVELLFATKPNLLKVAIDVAIAGDDEPVPVLHRPWATEARQSATVDGFLTTVAEVLGQAAERSDALVLAALEAARGDQRLAPLAARLKAQRATTAGWIVDGLAARAALRPGPDPGTRAATRDAAQAAARVHAVDVVWLLMDPAVYARLTDDRGWTTERFARWFADSARRLLIED